MASSSTATTMIKSHDPFHHWSQYDETISKYYEFELQGAGHSSLPHTFRSVVSSSSKENIPPYNYQFYDEKKNQREVMFGFNDEEGDDDALYESTLLCSDFLSCLENKGKQKIHGDRHVADYRLKQILRHVDPTTNSSNSNNKEKSKSGTTATF